MTVSCHVRIMSWSSTWLSVFNIIIAIISFSFRCLILRTFCNTVSNYSHANNGYFCCCCFCIWATRFVSVLNTSSNLASGVASSSHPFHTLQKLTKASFRVIPSLKICEVSLCFLTIIFLGSIFLTAHWLHFITCNCLTSLELRFAGFYPEDEPSSISSSFRLWWTHILSCVTGHFICAYKWNGYTSSINS